MYMMKGLILPVKVSHIPTTTTRDVSHPKAQSLRLSLDLRSHSKGPVVWQIES
jgi:hypothetical protein